MGSSSLLTRSLGLGLYIASVGISFEAGYYWCMYKLNQKWLMHLYDQMPKRRELQHRVD